MADDAERMVTTVVDDSVAVVTLDRPPVNALSQELVAELQQALMRCAQDDVRAVVITGRRHFAAGADLRALAAFRLSHPPGTPVPSLLPEAIRSLECLPKPTIAAIRGYALGGGLELALAADVRILAVDAQVGQPEVKLGLIPGAGGTQRLQRLVGTRHARRITLFGERMDAEEAQAIGLADAVVPTEDLLGEAVRMARRFAQGPTKAYAALKRCLREGWGQPLDTALRIERDAYESVVWSHDAAEGMAAFLEKRSANFSGR